MLSLRFSNAIVTITLATFLPSASAQSQPGETPTVETSPNLQLQGRIEGIAIKGNTAFSDRELFQTANEFIGKSATAARLLRAPNRTSAGG